MHPEIDLVPLRYRERLRLRRWLTVIAIALGIAVLGIAASKGALLVLIRVEETKLAGLQDAQSEAARQKVRLEELRSKDRELTQQLALLEGLRGATPARRMFHAIDRSLDGSVWFRNWQFRRAGEFVESKPEGRVAGYFVVVPAASQDEPERAWRLETHMEIQAQATDHSALAAFVRRLVAQPEIEDVRILSTRVRDQNVHAVEFELAVVVRNRA